MKHPNLTSITSLLALGLVAVLTACGPQPGNEGKQSEAPVTAPTEEAQESTDVALIEQYSVEDFEVPTRPTPAPVELRAATDIPWETNMDDPVFGSPDAKKGGTLRQAMRSYPLTFRLHGPNSNDYFANWNRTFGGDGLPLVVRHPDTDNYIPALATHWFADDDHRTVYYKLDPDARWSDGEPITADDYLFTFEFMQTTVIPLPAYNSYAENYYQDVVKLDDYTIAVVGKQPSWRPLDDYGLFPMPEHDIEISADWPKEANYKAPVVQGPYVITDFKSGERVTFERLKDWWGYDKKYFTGLYNVDRIELQVINDPDRYLDYFLQGQIDFHAVMSAREWETKMDLEEIDKGWVHRKRIFTDTPQGLSGIFLNLKTPIFQNRDFRKALQYLFNFDEVNSELMYNAYYRSVSAFEGTEYENHDLTPYGFNPRKASEHLKKAGFTRRGDDGILVNDKGQRASFKLLFSGPTMQPHMNTIKNQFEKAGVEINLQLLEGGAMFEKGLEKSFEAMFVGWTAGYYPGPHQYFSSEFAETTQNNNFFSFGHPVTDALIDIYRYDMDKEDRLEAMHLLDRIIQDEAMYIPFWQAPFVRFLYWDYVQWPEDYLPRRAPNLIDYHVFWIDPERKAALEAAMAEGRSLGEDTVIDLDPYGVKADMMEASAAAEAE